MGIKLYNIPEETQYCNETDFPVSQISPYL